MADVVADPQMPFDHFESVFVRRSVTQSAEECDGLGRCFEHAARLRFDGQSNCLTGLGLQSSQPPRELDQVANALRLEVCCCCQRLESERNGREAAIWFGRQRRANQLGQHASAVPRVLQSTGLSPIRQVDVFFDSLAVKVSKRKRIERVGAQPQLCHASRELF